MSRGVLAGLGALVLALVVGLVFLLSGRGEDKGSAAVIDPASPRAPQADPGPGRTPEPRHPGPGSPSIPGTDPAAPVIADDGRIVRDHRGRDEDAGPPPPIKPRSVALFRGRATPGVQDCVTSSGDGAPGKVWVTARLTAAGGVVKASDIRVQTEADSTDETLASCIAEAVAALEVATPEQGDGSYEVQMPFSLR